MKTSDAMHWTRGAVVVATVAAVAFGLAASVARAGNGTVPAPTGTIYFQDLSTLDASTNTVMLFSMDGEGANRSEVLRTDRYVRPSRLLHGSPAARWFLTMKTIEGAGIGGKPRRDVFAVRADGAEVRITTDPTMEYWMPEWTPAEASNGGADDSAVVSMLARRWTSDASDATVVVGTAGMYLAYVSFAGTPYVRAAAAWGQISATDPDPRLWGRLFDASVLDRDSAEYFASCGGTAPDVAAYTWLPNLGLAVQDLDPANPRIRMAFWDSPYGFSEIGGIHAGTLEVIQDLPPGLGRLPGQDPHVRFGFSTLLFSRLTHAPGGATETWVVQSTGEYSLFYGNADGGFTEASVAAPVNATTKRSLSRPMLSPDGNYVAYQVNWHGSTGKTSYIQRATGGLGPKDLTPEVKSVEAGATGMVLVAWR